MVIRGDRTQDRMGETEREDDGMQGNRILFRGKPDKDSFQDFG